MLPASARKPRFTAEQLEMAFSQAGLNVKDTADIYPLSPLQQGIMYHSLNEPEQAVYVNTQIWKVEGKLDPAAFHEAWRLLVERHAIFRTAFLGQEFEAPLQAVLHKVELPFQIHDWRDVLPALQRERLQELLKAECSKPFQLAIPPLTRICVVLTAEFESRMLWTSHHLLLDAWSQPILLKELVAAYEALKNSKRPRFNYPVPYKNFVGWLQCQDLSRAESYWRERLRGFRNPSRLELSNVETAKKAETGQAVHRHFFDLDLGELYSFARSYRCTLNTLIQTAWALTMRANTGQRDIVFGVTLSGRPVDLPDSESMVGLFINTLPLRVQIDPREPMLKLLLEVQTRQSELLEYQYSALVDVRQWSELQPGLALFDSTVVVEASAGIVSEQESNSTIRLEKIGSAEQVHYPLALNFGAHGLLALRVTYDRSRFDITTIKNLVGQFQRALHSLVADPHSFPQNLRLMSEEEREQQLLSLRGQEVGYRKDVCFHEWIGEQAALQPEAIALIEERGELSYGELEIRSNQLAHRLRGLGVGPEVVVGVCMRRSAAMVVSLLAIAKAGGAYLPLDERYPVERLAYILADASVSILLTEMETEHSLPAHWGYVLCVDGEAERERIGCEQSEVPLSGVSREHLAYVIYTSGSTGQPKGTMLTHGSLLNYLNWAKEAYRLEEGKGAPVNTPIAFDATVTSLWLPLVCGLTVTLLPEQGELESLGEALRGRAGYSLVKLTPAHLEGLQRLNPESEWEGSAAALVIGGEALRYEDLLYWRQHAPGMRLINEYGPTETVVGCCVFEVGELGKGNVPIGRPIGNTWVYVLDEELEPVPVGVTGELYIGGAGVGRGYWKRAGMTAERFLADAYGPAGSRMYRTGDRVRYRRDGNLEFIGRSDYQVKVRGYRIELGEIETVLLQAPGVKQAVVVAQQQDDQQRLVAYVAADGSVDHSTLRAHVRRILPEYMLPSDFVILNDLPLNVHGKIDREQLPSLQPPDLRGPLAAPRTPTEQALATIWMEVLKCNQVDIHHNFFELGGHSLSAMRVVARVRRLFGIELALQILFDAPTVNELAAYIDLSQRKDNLTPIVHQTSGGAAPLSFAQERLWFLDQLGLVGAAYNTMAALRIEGALDVDALERSFREVVRRHETLRAHFSTDETGPTLVFDGWETFQLNRVDLKTLSIDEQEERLQQLMNYHARERFDLAKGPLFKVALLAMSEVKYVTLVSMHHVVCDGWSMNVLSEEIGALYSAFSQGLPSPLAELSIQYADYAIWQRGWLQGEVLEHQLAYWKEQLGGAPAALELPTDRPRLTVPSFRGGRVPIQLTEELTVGLRALAYQEGVTMYMVLLAGLQVLLSRWSGQQDIVVGSPIAGRIHQELEGLIGYFANTLALRTDLTGEPSFREVLRRVRETALGAYAHQDLPFEKLVAELQTHHDLSRHPIFQVVLTFGEVPRRNIKFDTLHLSTPSYSNEQAASKFDLTFILREENATLMGSVGYASDLFDKETVERLVLYLERVLLSVVREPGLAITALSLLREEEVEEQVHEWNLTECSYAWDRGVHELIGKQAARTPLAVAVRDAAGELRYGELDEQANQLGHYLRSVGVGPEVVVGLCVRRSRALVVGILGILKAGGAYLPLDEHQPVERLGYLLEDAGVTVVVTESSLEAMLPSVWGQVVVLDEESQREVIASQPREAPEVAVHADNVAYVIYTSGSTGSPKGVMVRHGGLSNYVQYAAERFSTDEGTGSPINSSASFDLVVTSLYPTLIGGKTLHLLSGKDDVQELAELLRNGHDLTLMKLTPSHLEALTKLLAWEDLKGRVRSIVLGGEKLALSVVSGWHQASPETRFYNHYGPTETTVGCIVQAIDWESESGGIVPIGRPISNMRVYVLDGHVRPVPQGTIGELYIAGAGLARGYLGRAGLTAERFLADPYGPPGSRMYQTGDRVRYRPDRTLEFIGRTDYQVKIRGYRVELGEVEARMRACPGVAQAVVVAREEPGEVTRLVAYVVAGQQRIEGQELRSQLQRSLPEYMVPASYVFLDALPLTTNGKIDRGRLPAPDTGISTSRYVAAQTPVEQTLATIWCEVLKLERVGVEEDFFELGGHSLLATRVVAQVREVLTVEVPLRELFEQPRIRELAERIEWLRRQQLGTMLPPLEHQARPSGGVVLSFAQERLWFLEQMGLVGAAYTIPLGLRLRGVLDARALEASFAELVRRHESLRTRFEMQEGEAVQVIDAPAVFGLEQHDLRALTPELQEQEIQLQMKRRSQQSLDLMNGPLFNVALFLLQEREHVVLLTMHHIISDGWSGGILVRELSTLYAVYSQGLPSPLPELPIQYADYARWQRSWLCGDVLNRQLAYWREQLSGAPAALELPTDHPRPAVASYQGLKLPFTLDKALTEKLLALARREHTTLFMVLLAAYQLLLARLSGQNDVVVGSPIAGRTHRQTEDLIGFFVNTLVMRTHLQPQFSFRQLLQHVKNVTLAAYDHQDLPFEKLVAELQPQRSLSRQPIFQALLTLQNMPQETMNISGLTFERYGPEQLTSKFDFTIFARDTPSGLIGAIEYAKDLFEEETVQRWSGYYQRILSKVVEDPGCAISQMRLMSEEEREQQLLSLRGQEVGYRKDVCFHEWIGEQAALQPEAIALIEERGELSYGELEIRSNQLAHRLRGLGVGPEVVVGVCMRRSAAMVVSLLAIAKAGGAYLPLDERYPDARVQYLLSDSGASIVVSEQRLSSRLSGPNRLLVCVDGEAERERIGCEQSEVPLSGVSREHLAYVIYTSGSTGQPKGTMLTHGSLLNYLNWAKEAYRLEEGKGAPVNTPIAFDATVTSLWLPLVCGLTVTLLPEQGELESLGEALRGRAGYSLVKLTPAHLEGLQRLNPESEWEGSAAALVIGGEALRYEDLLYWRQHAPGMRLINEYGPTETVVGCCVFEVGELGKGNVPIGRPIGNTWVYVLDEELEPVPVGVTGELYIGGAGVGRGYWKRAGMTAERFLADAYGPAGSRMYRTGDRVRYRRDGNLEFIGRSDYQVKVRGYRIELGEIETVLLQAPGVKQAVVVAQQQDDQQRLVAYVAADVEALKAESEEKFEGVKEETVGQWERLFSDNYEGASVEGPTFVGWNSSYTGEPIIEEQMQEWLECTVQRIRKLAPHEVLEIGCGVGLLVQALAPDCSRYRGVDFSLTAIEELRRWIEGREDLRNVELAMCEARHLDTIAGRYDTVLLNSVIQYFPDVQYLEEVLRKAVQKVEPGGQVYIGDVRHLGLLHAFHTSVQLSKGSEGLSVSTLRGRIERAVSQDKELVVDPALFRQMGTEWGVSVAMELKGGWANNELNCYRYEVVLVVPGGDKEDSQSAPPMIAWSEGSSMGELTQRLEQAMPSGLRITGIPNCRVSRDLTAWALIERSSPSRSVEDLIRELQEIDPGGEEPEEFRRLAEQFGYTAQVHLSEEGPQQFEVEFFPSLIASRSATRRTEADFEPQRSPQARAFRQLPPESLTPYANDPTRSSLLQRLTTALRERLRDALPDYMVPSAVVALDEMPLTQNGKVDRERLPSTNDRPEVTGYCAPRTPIEAALAEIFAEMLKMDRVGVNDNFFQLGGHSLLATRLIAQLREALSVNLPLRALFEHPTAASLAAYIVSEIVAAENAASLDSALSAVLKIGKTDPTAALPAFF